jgi:hypothetical protein
MPCGPKGHSSSAASWAAAMTAVQSRACWNLRAGGHRHAEQVHRPYRDSLVRRELQVLALVVSCSVDLYDRCLLLAGLRTDDLNGWSGGCSGHLFGFGADSPYRTRARSGPAATRKFLVREAHPHAAWSRTAPGAGDAPAYTGKPAPPARQPRRPAKLALGLLVRQPADLGHYGYDALACEESTQPRWDPQRRLGAQTRGQERQPLRHGCRVVDDVVEARRAPGHRGRGRGRDILDMAERPDALPPPMTGICRLRPGRALPSARRARRSSRSGARSRREPRYRVLNVADRPQNLRHRVRRGGQPGGIRPSTMTGVAPSLRSSGFT